MKRARGEVGSPTSAAAGAAAAAEAGGMVKGRSCKGCLFYSSVLKSRALGPVCVGVTHAVPQDVPKRMIGEIELEAIQEGRNLLNFKYACVGYSTYLDDKQNSVGKREKHLQAQLPICVGVELLADRKGRPKQGRARDGFLTKFQRNAGLVANGVARNLNKVGSYIKDTVGDMMYPARKRPK